MNNWHKIIGLLLHSMELTEFQITEADIEAFKRDYQGKRPTVTLEEREGAVYIRLMPNQEAARLVQ